MHCRQKGTLTGRNTFSSGAFGFHAVGFCPPSCLPLLRKHHFIPPVAQARVLGVTPDPSLSHPRGFPQPILSALLSKSIQNPAPLPISTTCSKPSPPATRSYCFLPASPAFLPTAARGTPRTGTSGQATPQVEAIASLFPSPPVGLSPRAHRALTFRSRHGVLPYHLHVLTPTSPPQGTCLDHHPP